MNGQFYQFKLGVFTCIAVSDGGLNYPIEGFFKDRSVDDIKAMLTAHNLPTTHIAVPYTLLFIDTGTHKVLVDVGAGPNLAKEAATVFANIDNSQSITGSVVANLAAAGVQPGDIDTVIITHAHPS